MRALVVLAMPAAAVLAGAGMRAVPTVPLKDFPHQTHLALISDCTTCHAGVTTGGSYYPEPSFCQTCHGSGIAPEINWSRPSERIPFNQRFDHGRHIGAAGNECTDCHVESGKTGIQLAVVDQCRDCHSRSGVLFDGSVMHGDGWVNRHSADAAGSPRSCADCHVRSDCLDCHRSDAASGSSGYHAAGFLSSHPRAAYSRETSCSDCHNVGSFCASCHAQAGLVSQGAIGGSGYHDGKQNFGVGHGQAARQSLESCVACHTEADCLRCHSALSGRINPHGPGFDATKLREKNPSMCAVCHGRAIPGGG